MAKKQRTYPPGKYQPAPEQSEHSDKLVKHALWWIKSKADDLRRGRETMCAFQGEYDGLQNMNLPIACKKTGEDKNTGEPIFNCFRHPPLDKASSWLTPEGKPMALRLETYTPKSKRKR